MQADVVLKVRVLTSLFRSNRKFTDTLSRILSIRSTIFDLIDILSLTRKAYSHKVTHPTSATIGSSQTMD